MVGEDNFWVQRFDVARILEENIDMNYWKGDDQTKGVFFTDEYGYTLNKVLGVRIKHDEAAPEVFYSFLAEEEESVVLEYPFKDLAIKPKNHHLLFNSLQLKKNELPNIFDVPYTYENVKVEIEPLIKLLESVQNKRERERSFLHFSIQGETGHFKIVRKQKKERIVKFSEIIKCEKISPMDVIRAQKQTLEVEHLKSHNEKTEKTPSNLEGSVNAHSLHYLLKIFSSLQSVLFRFSHDRIMITGDKQELKDKQVPMIEAVIALTKNI